MNTYKVVFNLYNKYGVLEQKRSEATLALEVGTEEEVLTLGKNLVAHFGNKNTVELLKVDMDEVNLWVRPE